MAKNSLYDLNDHLFERIEWLTDRDNVKGEDLAEELKRTEAVIKVSEQIIKNADLIHRATLAAAKFGGKIKLPAMIEGKP
jgi:predicted transcriptional regulator